MVMDYISLAFDVAILATVSAGVAALTIFLIRFDQLEKLYGTVNIGATRKKMMKKNVVFGCVMIGVSAISLAKKYELEWQFTSLAALYLVALYTMKKKKVWVK